MTAGSASSLNPHIPPILVLGLGNLLLGDDGVGPTLVERLAQEYEDKEASSAEGLAAYMLKASTSQIEFIDGGTQGLALLGQLAHRQALVILDALDTGQPPGTVSVLEGRQVMSMSCERSTSAHESNATELLAVAALLGDLPETFYLIGIQPAAVKTSLGLSAEVQRSLEDAAQKARDLIDPLLMGFTQALSA